MNRLSEELQCIEPTIAVPFTCDEDLNELDTVAGLAHVAEFRADMFVGCSTEDLRLRLQIVGGQLPTILTVRCPSEGGHWMYNDTDRRDTYLDLLSDTDGVDVELGAHIRDDILHVAGELGKVSLVSSHRFDETPSYAELDDLVGLAIETPADYIKVATMANSQEEYERLVELVINNKEHNLIVVAMGKYGPLSRTFLPSIGSQMTYASVGASQAAPGQLNVFSQSRITGVLYPN